MVGSSGIVGSSSSSSSSGSVTSSSGISGSDVEFVGREELVGKVTLKAGSVKLKSVQFIPGGNVTFQSSHDPL